MTNAADTQTSYVQDVTFGSDYVQALQPALLSYVAAASGFEAPDASGAFSYLELGCSDGKTLNGLAASNPDSRFVGIDFNAHHIELARADAQSANLQNVEYHQADFRDFGKLGLARFDFAAINGAYSWLDPGAENAVHTIIDTCLNDNGLFFVDYMSLPGKAPLAPMWHLMRTVTDAQYDSSAARASEGFGFLTALVGQNAQYFTSNPHVKSVHDNWKSALESRPTVASQLAHNALTEHWCPKYFTEVCEAFGAFGLSFAGSTDLDWNDLELTLPHALQSVNGRRLDRAKLETVKDFFHYTQQRTDVFVRSGKTPEPDDGLMTSSTHVSPIWPHSRPVWEFNDANKRPVKVNPSLFDRAFSMINEGTTGAKDIVEALIREGHSREDAAQTVRRVLLVQDFRVFARAPHSVDQASLRQVKPRNGYNAFALAKYVQTGQTLLLSADRLGACISLPELVSVVTAAFVGPQIEELSVDEVVGFVRKVPGAYRTGQGRQVAGADITREMIAPACDLVKAVVLPGLVSAGALEAV